jgi:hypothetical protein
MHTPDLESPLWRVRRRGDWIDATLSQSRDKWRLAFTRKGRLLADWEFDTRLLALDAARARLQELERVGWTRHW